MDELKSLGSDRTTDRMDVIGQKSSLDTTSDRVENDANREQEASLRQVRASIAYTKEVLKPTCCGRYARKTCYYGRTSAIVDFGVSIRSRISVEF